MAVKPNQSKFKIKPCLDSFINFIKPVRKIRSKRQKPIVINIRMLTEDFKDVLLFLLKDLVLHVNIVANMSKRQRILYTFTEIQIKSIIDH